MSTTSTQAEITESKGNPDTETDRRQEYDIWAMISKNRQEEKKSREMAWIEKFKICCTKQDPYTEINPVTSKRWTDLYPGTEKSSKSFTLKRIHIQIINIMIGLHRPQNLNQNRDAEPIETRKLSKQQLYDSLKDTYLLPGIDSKGVNRVYLVQVFTGMVFRLTKQEWKRFDVDLTTRMTKRNNLVNMLYVLRKLNTLMEERMMRPLGFPDFVIPEEKWLSHIVRFVDRKNVLEFFEEAANPMANPQCLSEQVHQARVNAHQFVFDGNNILDNLHVYKAVKLISEAYRRTISRRIDIEELRNTIQQYELKLQEEDGLMKASVMKAGTTIVAVARGDFDPETMLAGGEGAEGQRQELGQITRLLRFIYCTDSVLDRGEEITQMLNEYAVARR